MKLIFKYILVFVVAVRSFGGLPAFASEKSYLEKQFFMNLAEAKQRCGASHFQQKLSRTAICNSELK